MQQATGLVAQGPHENVSNPPNFVSGHGALRFGAVEGALFQQLMFVGAALSAMILVCSFEAWSAREIPVRSDDETRLRNPSDH
jgi:hypothetical protein